MLAQFRAHAGARISICSSGTRPVETPESIFVHRTMPPRLPATCPGAQRGTRHHFVLAYATLTIARHARELRPGCRCGPRSGHGLDDGESSGPVMVSVGVLGRIQHGRRRRKGRCDYDQFPMSIPSCPPSLIPVLGHPWSPKARYLTAHYTNRSYIRVLGKRRAPPIGVFAPHKTLLEYCARIWTDLGRNTAASWASAGRPCCLKCERPFCRCLVTRLACAGQACGRRGNGSGAPSSPAQETFRPRRRAVRAMYGRPFSGRPRRFAKPIRSPHARRNQRRALRKPLGRVHRLYKI